MTPADRPADRALDQLYRLLLWAVAGLLALLTVVVSYQAFSRYIPFLPRLLWTEEAARFCFIWMVMLGAAIAVRAGTHFTIDVLPDRMSPRVRTVLNVTTVVLVTLAITVLLAGGARFAWLGRDRVSTTSGIPLVWVYAAFPVSALAMLAFAVEWLLATVRGDVRPEDLMIGGAQDTSPRVDGTSAGTTTGGE